MGVVHTTRGGKDRIEEDKGDPVPFRTSKTTVREEIRKWVKRRVGRKENSNGEKTIGTKEKAPQPLGAVTRRGGQRRLGKKKEKKK